ncbi:MAG: hypothetical protein AB8B63_18240 [Granulosicoccus sp.]
MKYWCTEEAESSPLFAKADDFAIVRHGIDRAVGSAKPVAGIS